VKEGWGGGVVGGWGEGGGGRGVGGGLRGKRNRHRPKKMDHQRWGKINRVLNSFRIGLLKGSESWMLGRKG